MSVWPFRYKVARHDATVWKQCLPKWIYRHNPKVRPPNYITFGLNDSVSPIPLSSLTTTARWQQAVAPSGRFVGRSVSSFHPRLNHRLRLCQPSEPSGPTLSNQSSPGSRKLLPLIQFSIYDKNYYVVRNAACTRSSNTWNLTPNFFIELMIYLYSTRKSLTDYDEWIKEKYEL